MSKDCDFRDYPFCNKDCFTCYWRNIICPTLAIMADDIESRVGLDKLINKKVKEVIDENRLSPTERNGLEVTSKSLYKFLKNMDKDDEIYIDFFINGRWRFSSKSLELFKVEECLNYLPDELITSNCELVSDSGVTRVKVSL